MILGMRPAIDQFAKDLRADSRFTNLAEAVAKAFGELEAESVCNRHADAFMRAVAWICDQPRSIDAKLAAFQKLLAIPRGPAVFSMRLLTGWQT